MPSFGNFLTEGSFMPHGHCYLWKPELVGLHIISDALIALAYYSIPITLVYFVRRREDLAFSWIFLLFGAFILSCGTTHIMEVWTLWHPTYWVSGSIKFITAAVSVYTAVTLVPLVPQALALPSPAQMETANVELKREIAYRAQAESDLRESEERFRSAFDYAAIGVAMVAPDGRWLKVNRSLCEIVGYSEQEMLATTFQAITYPDDLNANLNYMRQLLSGEKSCYQIEKRYFHKNGCIVWINLSVSLVRDINGQPKYFITQVQDISESKSIERELQKEREFLNAVLENISDGIVACDDSGDLTLFNRATREFHGLPAQPLPASAWAEYYDLYLADGKTPMTMADIPLFRALQGEVVRNSEMVIAAKQGRRRTLVASGEAIFDAEGNKLGAVVSMHDISERLRSEMALKKLNDSLEIRVQQRTVQLMKANQELRKWGDIFQHTRQGLIIPSSGSKILEMMNPAFAKMHGYTVEELTGLPIPTILAPERLVETVEQIRLSYEKEESTFETLHIRKDGTVFPVLLEITQVKDESGKFIYSIVNIRDITEVKQAEAEIRTALAKERELNELKSRFITMTSHEFRTPLATILSSTELLEYYSHKLPESEKRELFGQIGTAIKRMTQLLNDVLDINKSEAGKIEFNPASLDLSKFCHSLVSEMQLSAGNKHEIVFTNSGDCPSAVMDEKLLGHIFSNLLSNAIKYSPSGGVVEFELACQESEAIFQIKDCGIGIPLEDRQKLFESFHRASNVGNIQGTGLGLSIVKSMVDLHGGQIQVLSEVGIGTTFTVTLPLG